MVCRRQDAAQGQEPRLELHRSQAPFVESAFQNERLSSVSITVLGMCAIGVLGGAGWLALSNADQAALRREPVAIVQAPEPEPVVVKNEGTAGKPALDLDDEPLAGRSAALPEAELSGPAALQRKRDEQRYDPKQSAAQRALEQEQDRRRHAEIEAQLDHSELGAARRAVKITMYSTTWCGACNAARAYMTAKKISFTDYDIEKNPAARAQAHMLNPKRSIPVITVDHEMMIGFGAENFEALITNAARRRAGK